MEIYFISWTLDGNIFVKICRLMLTGWNKFRSSTENNNYPIKLSWVQIMEYWKSHSWDSSTRMCWWVPGQIFVSKCFTFSSYFLLVTEQLNWKKPLVRSLIWTSQTWDFHTPDMWKVKTCYYIFYAASNSLYIYILSDKFNSFGDVRSLRKVRLKHCVRRHVKSWWKKAMCRELILQSQ